MTLTKLVNGERIELTQPEIDAFNAREQQHNSEALSRYAERYKHVIRAHLIEKAIEMDYDGEHGILSYISSSIASYKADADKYLSWRDQVWLYADEIIKDVKAGTVPPVSMADFKRNIPVME